MMSKRMILINKVGFGSLKYRYTIGKLYTILGEYSLPSGLYYVIKDDKGIPWYTHYSNFKPNYIIF